jgi:hypothetical protein
MHPVGEAKLSGQPMAWATVKEGIKTKVQEFLPRQDD